MDIKRNSFTESTVNSKYSFFTHNPEFDFQIFVYINFSIMDIFEFVETPNTCISMKSTKNNLMKTTVFILFSIYSACLGIVSIYSFT